MRHNLAVWLPTSPSVQILHLYSAYIVHSVYFSYSSSKVLGGRLKFEEMVSGRFADAFGTLYLGYACLWYYQQNKSVKGIDAVFEMAMETILQQNQEAIRGGMYQSINYQIENFNIIYICIRSWK